MRLSTQSGGQHTVLAAVFVRSVAAVRVAITTRAYVNTQPVPTLEIIRPGATGARWIPSAVWIPSIWNSYTTRMHWGLYSVYMTGTQKTQP